MKKMPELDAKIAAIMAEPAHEVGPLVAKLSLMELLYASYHENCRVRLRPGDTVREVDTRRINAGFALLVWALERLEPDFSDDEGYLAEEADEDQG